MHKKRILKFFRNTVSVALALSMLISNMGTGLSTVHAQEATQTVETESEAAVSEEEVNASADYGLADNIQDGVILHCFDWKYNDIKAELKNIAEAGFTSVQTSPAQRDEGFSEWYYLYQPQGFTISDRNPLGTKAELKALCDEAENYGIKVIVDVIGNHTRGMDGPNGPIDDNLKRSEFFRWENRNSSDMSADDWNNRYLVTHCNVGMRDLVTENSDLQDIIAGYLAELKSVGVDGIRWDTAKHIGLPSEDGSQFWPKMAAQGLYQYGEILEGPSNATDNEDIKKLMKEYTDYMSVTDNNYGSRLCGAFRDGQVPGDSGVWVHKGITSNKLVYWGESHDTYANDVGEGGWTKYIDQNIIDRAYAIAASRADATALYYSRPLETEKTKILAGAKGSTHFTAKEVAEVNKFHNNAIGERDYYVAGSDAAAVCRESGAVIVKASGSGNVSVANGGGLTKPGTYTDKVSGGQWTVTSSTISGPVGSSGIAVIYEEKTINPSVSASVADGSSFTTDTLDVTFTLKNAKSAAYSVDGGAEKTFTDSTKLTLGADTAFGSSVKVKITITGEDGSKVEKTFTYTKKEAGKVEKNTVYFTKPSGWSGAYIYAYVPAGATATKLTGEWPGTAMTSEGDGVYTYTFADSVTEAKVIFAEGASGQQTPTDDPTGSAGYDYTSGKAYTYSDADGWKAVNVSTATNTPTPTNTSTPTPTSVPTGIEITSSLADGSSFATETKTITLTLKNAQKGTYCVDNGPVKEFTGSADVVIGKGKIADSTVTVKVTAEGDGKTAEKTFEFKKEFIQDNAQPAVNAGAEEEVAVEEVAANTAAETDAYYATNPNGGVGKEATITSMNDFTQDMLVARSGAWDVPNAWNGAHENSVADCYGLYAAWDDNNLYVGLEMVNTTDTWQREGEASLLDNGKMSDVPIVLAMNVGNKTPLTGKSEDGKGIWQMNTQYETRVDHLFVGSTRGTGTPGLFLAKEDGTASYDPEYCLSYKDNGITYTITDGSISPQIMHLKGSTSVSDAYDASKYVDAMTDGNGHNRKYDTFFLYTIPLKVLGIDKNYLTNTGIGIMGLGTRQESALDCVPHDPSMLDNTMKPYRAGDNTSYEKEDLDIITVPLASVGKLNSGGGTIVTNTPTPTAKPTTTTAPTGTTAPTPIPGSDLSVNFGADRSAPQYNTTALQIKAIPNGGTAPYNYEFFVDNVSVQNGADDTYTWQNGSAGAHTIKVIVTDSENKTVTIEKEYDLEQDADTPILTVTVQPTASPTPVVTNEPTGTAAPTPTQGGTTSNLTVTKFNVSCLTEDGRYKIGDTYVMKAEVTGAQGTPLYMFTYVLNGEEVVVKRYDSQSEARFVATEPGKYTFKVYVVDENNETNPEFEVGEIEIYDNPDVTILPTVTSAPGVTITPNPIISEVPVVTATPQPTAVVTDTPVPTKAVKPTATAAPKSTAIPTPAQGSKVTVNKTTYKVTGTGSSKTVEYAGYKGTSTTVNIPSTVKINGVSYKVTTIGDKAFKGNTKLKVVKIPANVTKIGSSAFYGCTNLWKVKSGVNVTSIGSKAFYNCKKLSSITMSKKLTTIGSSAFYKCTSLKKITLNTKVSKIGSKAFYGCKNLKTITIKTKKLTSKNVGSKAFKGINSKATIKAPSSKLASYKKILKSKGVGSKATFKKS